MVLKIGRFENRSDMTGKFQNVVLEKGGENNLD
jgi:hypothetical protein